MKIVTIIGTRPQFIKMSLLSKELNRNNIKEIIIHTGQHFDKNMSDNFFDELNIPSPNYHLNINRNTVGESLGQMIGEISKILVIEKPDYVMVYGDCDTTLAGALAANKLDFKIIHIESGLRSYDKTMPEEVNRVLVDNISNMLFCPTENAKNNLIKEGIKDNIYVVGDLMVDLVRENIEKINNISLEILLKYGLDKKEYYLMTLHRKSNVNIEKFQHIFEELGKLEKKIIFPIHPRSKQIIDKIELPKNIELIEPVNFFEMMALLHSSIKLITDSGGLQKEAYELNVPCITIRESTEWIETLDGNMNILTTNRIYENIKKNILYIKSEIFKNKSYENIVKILL